MEHINTITLHVDLRSYYNMYASYIFMAGYMYTLACTSTNLTNNEEGKSYYEGKSPYGGYDPLIPQWYMPCWDPILYKEILLWSCVEREGEGGEWGGERESHLLVCVENLMLEKQHCLFQTLQYTHDFSHAPIQIHIVGNIHAHYNIIHTVTIAR